MQIKAAKARHVNGPSKLVTNIQKMVVQRLLLRLKTSGW